MRKGMIISNGAGGTWNVLGTQPVAGFIKYGDRHYHRQMYLYVTGLNAANRQSIGLWKSTDNDMFNYGAEGNILPIGFEGTVDTTAVMNPKFVKMPDGKMYCFYTGWLAPATLRGVVAESDNWVSFKVVAVAPLGAAGAFDETGMTWDSVVPVGNKLYVYYSASTTFVPGLMIFNGDSLSRPKLTRCLTVGGGGTFDELRATTPKVVYHDGFFWMYYAGINAGFVSSIGLAKSRNGWDFNKVGQVIPAGAFGYLSLANAVVDDGVTYVYTSSPVTNQGIVSSSDNGVSFISKVSFNPTGNPADFDGTTVLPGAVVKDIGETYLYPPIPRQGRPDYPYTVDETVDRRKGSRYYGFYYGFNPGDPYKSGLATARNRTDFT